MLPCGCNSLQITRSMEKPDSSDSLETVHTGYAPSPCTRAQVPSTVHYVIISRTRRGKVVTRRDPHARIHGWVIIVRRSSLYYKPHLCFCSRPARFLKMYARRSRCYTLLLLGLLLLFLSGNSDVEGTVFLYQGYCYSSPWRCILRCLFTALSVKKRLVLDA